MDISNAAAKAHAPHSSCGGCVDDSAPAAPPAPLTEDTTRFRIDTMDCAAEESEIRRAVDPIVGIRHLRFDLGRRLLDLNGTPDAIEQAEAAMRRIGFDPRSVATERTAAASGTVAESPAGPAPFGAGPGAAGGRAAGRLTLVNTPSAPERRLKLLPRVAVSTRIRTSQGAPR